MLLGRLYILQNITGTWISRFHADQGTKDKQNEDNQTRQQVSQLFLS